MSGRGSVRVCTPPRPLRAVGLLSGALAATEALRRLVSPALGAVVEAVAAETPWQQLPLATVVAAGCASALVVCWAWLVLAGSAVAVGALRRRHSSPDLACPTWVRTLVLAALGFTVATGPAAATPPVAPPGPSGGGPGLVGLALPDRTSASRTAPGNGPRAASSLRVRPGDSLWSIAAHHLPPHSTDAEVSRAWRVLAATNADRIGHDPDLILPGTVLRLPALDDPADSTLRKES